MPVCRHRRPPLRRPSHSPGRAPGDRAIGRRMPAFSVEDIVRGTGGALLGGDLGIAVSGVSIDSRSLGIGEAFFAIRGERLDGHAFLREAVGRGAACLGVVAVTDELLLGVPVGLVDETTRALGRMGAWNHARFAIPVAPVTTTRSQTY